MAYYSFDERHNGPDKGQIDFMLQTVGASDLDELISKTIPDSILIKGGLQMEEGLSEFEYLRKLRKASFKNKLFKSYIGLGYYNTVVPGVIQRNIFENPGWYTAYTPYQAEISQGRMEALLNYQTMVCDLTGMELANASLLDESTAAAEAMHMFFASRSREQVTSNANKFFVDEECFPQTIGVLITRSAPLGIELVVGNSSEFKPDQSYFGMLLQYPGKDGNVADNSGLVKNAKEHGVRVAVAADIMSLVMLTPPGEWGADCVVGTSQRFGVPLGYGGPHAAFFATKEEFKRDIPGRLIGVSIDAAGHPALRMALQTREQHIKRDKATSNICTAQVLLAVMAGMYAVYHGPVGLKAIATEIHQQALKVAHGLKKLGFNTAHENYFDTIKIITGDKTDAIQKIAIESGINFRYPGDGTVVISLDETALNSDVADIISVFAKTTGHEYKSNGVGAEISSSLLKSELPICSEIRFSHASGFQQSSL